MQLYHFVEFYLSKIQSTIFSHLYVYKWLWISWYELVLSLYHASWIEWRSSLVCVSLNHELISDKLLSLTFIVALPYLNVDVLIIKLVSRRLIWRSSQKIHLLCILSIETWLGHELTTLTLVDRRTTQAYLIILLPIWVNALDMLLSWISSKETHPWRHQLPCINSW